MDEWLSGKLGVSQNLGFHSYLDRSIILQSKHTHTDNFFFGFQLFSFSSSKVLVFRLFGGIS